MHKINIGDSESIGPAARPHKKVAAIKVMMFILIAALVPLGYTAYGLATDNPIVKSCCAKVAKTLTGAKN